MEIKGKIIKLLPLRSGVSQSGKAKLIRYADDPLLAECRGEIHVASTPTDCALFKQRTSPAVVEQRKKRIGITDIYI